MDNSSEGIDTSLPLGTGHWEKQAFAMVDNGGNLIGIIVILPLEIGV